MSFVRWILLLPTVLALSLPSLNDGAMLWNAPGNLTTQAVGSNTTLSAPLSLLENVELEFRRLLQHFELREASIMHIQAEAPDTDRSYSIDKLTDIKLMIELPQTQEVYGAASDPRRWGEWHPKCVPVDPEVHRTPTFDILTFKITPYEALFRLQLAGYREPFKQMVIYSQSDINHGPFHVPSQPYYGFYFPGRSYYVGIGAYDYSVVKFNE